jgi:hypothetical protein
VDTKASYRFQLWRARIGEDGVDVVADVLLEDTMTLAAIMYATAQKLRSEVAAADKVALLASILGDGANLDDDDKEVLKEAIREAAAEGMVDGPGIYGLNSKTGEMHKLGDLDTTPEKVAESIAEHERQVIAEQAAKAAEAEAVAVDEGVAERLGGTADDDLEMVAAEEKRDDEEWGGEPLYQGGRPIKDNPQA